VSDRPIMDEMDIRMQDWSGSGEDEIVEMDRMRKMIAERMVESKRISPHVTSFVEADVTGIVMWRKGSS
jgi:2-oxoglutarate dehydrogenase E2 component (dihydrolipoamide succinyltransferase)